MMYVFLELGGIDYFDMIRQSYREAPDALQA